MFLQEIKDFSKTNWWIYLLLTLALILVFITGRGNIFEIISLFLLNFLGNLFIMIMQKNYTLGKNKIGAIYHLSSTLVFASIGIYGLIYLNQYQYIIWQICYLIAAIKAFSFYNFKKDLKIFNEYFVGIVNLILFSVFCYFLINGLNIGEKIVFGGGFNLNIIGSIIMALGFSFVTTGLVSIKDKFRYFSNLLGIIFIIIGAFIGVYSGYLGGNIDGVSLGYMILTLTTFVFYAKLLRNYLK